MGLQDDGFRGMPRDSGEQQRGVRLLCTQARWAGWGEGLATPSEKGAGRKEGTPHFRNNLMLISPEVLEGRSLLNDGFTASEPASPRGWFLPVRRFTRRLFRGLHEGQEITCRWW